MQSKLQTLSHAVKIKYAPLVQYFQRNCPELLAIYVFGSQVTKQTHSGSDLDLAILLPKTIEPMVLWKMMGELANQINMPVDIIDLCGASTVMQHQVISTGIRLFEKGISGRLFEVFVYNEKLALDARRLSLLEDIQQTGRVYD